MRKNLKYLSSPFRKISIKYWNTIKYLEKKSQGKLNKNKINSVVMELLLISFILIVGLSALILIKISIDYSEKKKLDYEFSISKKEGFLSVNEMNEAHNFGYTNAKKYRAFKESFKGDLTEMANAYNVGIVDKEIFRRKLKTFKYYSDMVDAYNIEYQISSVGAADRIDGKKYYDNKIQNEIYQSQEKERNLFNIDFLNKNYGDSALKKCSDGLDEFLNQNINFKYEWKNSWGNYFYIDDSFIVNRGVMGIYSQNLFIENKYGAHLKSYIICTYDTISDTSVYSISGYAED